MKTKTLADTSLGEHIEDILADWRDIDGVTAAESDDEDEDHDPVAVKALRSMPYSSYLQSEHWAKTRESALSRAGNRCQSCRATHRSLEVHHLTYERRGREDDEDLMVLCDRCHAIEHGMSS